MIPQRDLAPGYTIPPVLIGGWQLSDGHSERPVEAATLFPFWDRLLDRGFNTFDCADIYAGVERLIGTFVKQRRAGGLSLPQVHTKFVPDLPTLDRINRRQVATIVERSLTRLAVERLDLVQLHWWDTSREHYPDALGWLDDLRQEGKIHLLGLTNFGPKPLERLLATGIPIASLQVQYSVLDQRPARGLDGVARANRIALLCYGTLAGGFLTDRWLGAAEPLEAANRSETKYRLVIDDAGGWDWFQEVLTVLDRVARRQGVSVPSVALRWVLDRPEVGSAIVGLRSPEHLAAVETAVRLRLDPADLQDIEAVTGEFPGPPGDVYDVERRVSGRHGAIMRYDLNARAVD